MLFLQLLIVPEIVEIISSRFVSWSEGLREWLRGMSERLKGLPHVSKRLKGSEGLSEGVQNISPFYGTLSLIGAAAH